MNAEATSAALSRVQAWFAKRTPWQRRGLATAAGALATLGHAPFQLTLLYAVAITLMVWLLDVSATKEKKRLSAFSMGWFFGFGHFVTGLYWVAAAFNVESDVWGPLWGIPATIGLAAGLALFFGVGALIAILLWTNDVRRIAAFTIGFFVSEWLRGHAFTGFPWLLPAYVWTPGEPISQLASLIGAYGLALITLLIAAAPASLADGGQSAGRRFAPTLIAALVVGMGWGWGTQHLAAAPVDPPGAQPIVRVADSGLGQAEKWQNRPDQEWRVLQRYLEASGAPSDDNADSIVIWPEGAIPVVNFFMLDDPNLMAALGRGLGDRVLITGLTRYEARPEGIVYFNSAAIIDGVNSEARVSQISDKNHLVPFGEYMPGFIRALNIPSLQRVGNFEAGPRPTRLVVPGAPTAVVLICYEAIFPGMVPRGEGRPGWIVMVTNDAWFGGGSGPYQHYAMARYRAIEEGLPVARAASGGISAIVDAYGQEVSATNARVTYAEAQLPPALEETPFAKWGSIVLFVLFVFVATIRFIPIGRRGPGGSRA